MKWVIKYSYDTGDTFGTERGIEDLIKEYDGNGEHKICHWEDLDIAKRNLRRIKEHYDWYCSTRSSWSDDIPRPKWHRCLQKKHKLSDFEAEHTLALLKDDGTEMKLSHPEWIGHFESLNSAEIVPYQVTERDTDMRISF